MEIHEGFMSTEEIAQWFGCKSGKSLSNKTSKFVHRYEELGEYCEFVKVRGGFNITRILDPEFITYEKQRTEAYQYVQTNYKKYWRELDTMARVAAALFVDKPDKLDVTFNTIKYYLRQCKNTEYGDSKNPIGTNGTSDRVWAKIIGQIGKNVSLALKAQREYVELTDEEIELVHKRFNEWYTDINKFILDTKQDVAEGKITKEEAWNIFEERAGLSDSSYKEFLAAVSEEIKCNWITKASHLRDNAIPKEGKFDF